MNDLMSYLQDPADYPAGVSLYARYCPRGPLRFLLGLGESAYNRQKLLVALGALLPPGTPTQPATSLAVDYAVQWKPLYKQAGYLHATLEHVGKPERAIAARRILALFEQIADIWEAERSDGSEGGTPPGRTPRASQSDAPQQLVTLVTKSGSADPLQAHKQLLRLRVRLSKHRHNPAMADQVAQWEAEKKTLEDARQTTTHPDGH